MFPPGRGNDSLEVGQKFVISLFGTSQVFTAEGKAVRLREYEKGKGNQTWVCEMNSNGRIGMRNAATGCFLGRHKDQGEFACVVTHHLKHEWLTFTRLSLGGYSLMVLSPTGGDKISPVQRVDNKSNSPNLKIGTAVHQFGLHQLKDSVFRRFEWVVPDRLARSSAPYYDGEDSDESINETSIEFLHSHGIHNIISLNSVELSPRERGRLHAANISYSHIKTLEFTAPTQEQFDEIWNVYNGAGVAIVYCGYGDGRTGMAISAIQLFQGRTLSDLDYRANGVQCPCQREALNTLSERIHGDENHSDPPSAPDIQPPPYTKSEREK
ncbi:hypothetical protein C7212DRAFT_276563 [Tuber magnatum]|uniref:Swiss Army Knife protein DSP-PTPase phosphatase domain-containing protein n=1 Tax=Tuber magnatum TaxID=42249 RepID=A0A317SW06_9PEZI|nr:hypothetical protein C7212DRAFT_276563 [Tuber magnatum]